jgi:hypothetical protein
MNRISNMCAASLALASVAVSGSAQAACWQTSAVEAAQVRDLETMLMVASLRCRLTGRNFVSDYNSFVRKSRPALTEANERLRAHFSSNGGLNAYDSYVTSLANRHGGGDGLDCKAMEKLIDRATDEGDSLSKLADVAQAVKVRPRLPGSVCPTSIARAH